MLEHVPHWLGSLMHNVRAGHAKLAIVQDGIVTGDARLELSSLAFADGARLPERFTADGEGVSPPLTWRGVPAGTAALALLVEDPDAPAPNPLVHAVMWNLPPEDGSLPEGAVAPDGRGADDGSDVGRNSYSQEGWLPPDPPTGHGSHDYVFQLFALDSAAELDINPGRTELLEAIRGHVIAAGMLVGTYSRGEEASVGPVTASPEVA
ncbi:YbhB/YbcL family Raf kinase inhibitor-like protein [Sphingomonas sp. 8AM]|uniref:YbhB/YbcL family Raf kinase inhibitor-like protein n=1 Tax=Sphingomonas sp. 8AM TaxID=2653170 RepID=UPI0012F2C418|nr:YbhB/YbcL family Raf kinase inhibitor-like protein [Sphingomonas sp. 8AM]VXC83566.1 Phosphatidylethanolamine-binding protein [Sphingomonas sp. 8AM]